ncbi:MAG: hypothetical protein IT210_25970 [Armatimonadetes bacterium]|nr:hypothetical protein [Armatimonadota bacterium]
MRAEGDDAWSFLASLAGIIDAPADWPAEHDRYIDERNQISRTDDADRRNR